MKINVYSSGDMSVGIPGVDATVKFPDVIFNNSDREQIRKNFCDLFAELFDDEGTTVYFNDECPTCFSLLAGNKCSNQNCITNCPDED